MRNLSNEYFATAVIYSCKFDYITGLWAQHELATTRKKKKDCLKNTGTIFEKTFFLSNLRKGQISYGVCIWQAILA